MRIGIKKSFVWNSFEYFKDFWTIIRLNNIESPYLKKLIIPSKTNHSSCDNLVTSWFTIKIETQRAKKVKVINMTFLFLILMVANV